MIKVIFILLFFILPFLSIHYNYYGIENKEDDIENEKVVTRVLNDFDQRQRVRLFNNLVKTKKIINIRKVLEQNSTDYINKPIITDIFAIPGVNKTVVYTMYNVLNLPKKQSYISYSNFTLLYQNQSFYNMIGAKTHVEAFRDLKFIIPYSINADYFYATVFDKVRNLKFENMYIQVLKQKRIGGVAVCAMVSNYNTIGEVMSWISWYKLQNFSNVILYSIKPIPDMEITLAPAIQQGFLKYYQYQYPLNKRRKMEQRSIQLPVVNSCYYRHRNFYDTIAFIDVDEYIYSPINPFNPPSTMQTILRERSGDYFRVYQY